jgi:hypothetical protein
MGLLTSTEIEFLLELATDYQDLTDDLSQREWANVQAIIEKLDGMLYDEYTT